MMGELVGLRGTLLKFPLEHQTPPKAENEHRANTVGLGPAQGKDWKIARDEAEAVYRLGRVNHKEPGGPASCQPSPGP